MGVLKNKMNKPAAASCSHANKLSKKKPISEGRAPGDTKGLWKRKDTARYFHTYRQRREVKKYLQEYAQRPEVRERNKLRSRTDEEKAKRRAIRERYRKHHQEEIRKRERKRRKTPEWRKANSEYEKEVRECKREMKNLESSTIGEQTDAVYFIGTRRYGPAREKLEGVLAKMLSEKQTDNALFSQVEAFVWALGRIGDPRSVPLITKALDIAHAHCDIGLIKDCLMALGKTQNNEGRRVIKRFLRKPFGAEQNPSENIKDWAEQACWMSFLPKCEEEKAPTFKEMPLPPMFRRILKRL